ncbi:MAG: alpha-glucan family phosphorylase [Actinomycetota bacterium]|nr:alpha-glucan family phosphorylase [Actinomycetota bacterium]
MKASHVFAVGSALPKNLEKLEDIVSNLRWSWHLPSAELFRWIDPELFELARRNPGALLDRVRRGRLLELSNDPRFVESLNRIAADLERHVSSDAYFQIKYPNSNLEVAYFSPEFGITEALSQYSGGLGVLAGDHLKSASSLGVPITGVGIFYREGYFSQSLSHDGWQLEDFHHDPDSARLTSNDPSDRFTLEFGDATAQVQIRRASVGRIPLILLDTDVEGNDPWIRNISDRLYGGDTEHRILQEILLGIGGVKALSHLGIAANVFHMNEGHAGFLTIARMHFFVSQGLTIAEAIEATRSTTIFTTHTPVPAGIDKFDRTLVERYLSVHLSKFDMSVEDFLYLGSCGERSGGARLFNMAHLGLRMSSHANAVSKLHGDVSRDLFAELYPRLDVSQVPIDHVTNGVHARSWTMAEVDEILSKSLLGSWPEADASEFSKMAEIPLSDIAAAKKVAKARLSELLSDRLAPNQVKERVSGKSMYSNISPDTLVFGFARRFAPYKRATLLLSDPERLLRILNDPRRPVAFIFAGKAHPADDAGKELIKRIVTFARENRVEDRFIFIPDYDISIARHLYQGVDVWLNTPRRPLEASGTSGMKAAMNGTLNCSILDGWWAECYDGQNGFAPLSAPDGLSIEETDYFEANSLFETIEKEVVPLYFAQDANGERKGWYERVRYSMINLIPFVTGSRMVKDYTDKHYIPLYRRSLELFEDEFSKLREFTNWKSEVISGFEKVSLFSFEAHNDDMTEDGQPLSLHIEIAGGDLAPGDFEVEVLFGPVSHRGMDFQSYETLVAKYLDSRVENDPTQSDDEVRVIHRFGMTLDTATGGTYGYLIQVVPTHPLLASKFELGLRVSS